MIPTQFRAFCLPNNSSQTLVANQEPWKNTIPLPQFATKELYREYCKRPDTDHLFFNFTEGENSTLRVGHGNEPFRIFGVVADYDTPNMTAVEVAEGLKRVPANFPVFAHNQTFSGGRRMIWKFEAPVFYFSKEIFAKFMGRCIKELKLKSIYPGLDEHILTPQIYYCANADWSVNESASIRSSLLDLWMFESCKVDHFSSKGAEVPLDVVLAEMEKRFPGRWEGDFQEGARGVRFWETGSDAKAAIVKNTGMICFTGLEPFKSWESIFGRDFIQKYLEDRRGKSISEMHSDGTAYYRQLPDKQWDAMPSETARRHLKVVYGLTDTTKKGDSSSEIDAVLNHLEQRKRVCGAMPFPLNPNDTVHWNGMHFLNNSQARVLAPHPEPREWGLDFPWISSYLSTLFLDQKNLEIFLSWLHVWMTSAQRGQPCRGQSLFIVGPAGTGKSLLSRQVIARMVGGYADSRDHLVDGGRFNSSLFDKALWVLDDSTVLADAKAHARYSSLVKAMVANDSMQYEQKYGYSGAIPFVGRLVVTLNEDQTSLGMLPNTEQSLLDKAIFTRTSDTEVDVADTEAERYAIIDRELPSFMRWVVDFEMPAWVERDSRFGIKAWHDGSVLEEARQATTSHTVMQIVELWRESIQDTKEMTVTTTDLYQKLAAGYPDLMRGISLVGLGKHIGAAIELGACDWIRRH